MKIKAPIWMKFFIGSVTLLLVVVLLMTLFFLQQMVEKENNILETNASNNMHYANISIKNYLDGYDERISNVSVAQRFFEARNNENYRLAVREILSNICAENSGILSVFYIDSEHNYFNAGEVFLDINTQMRIVRECRAQEDYEKRKCTWRHEKAGRDYNSIVLCRDIIYVDNQYFSHNVGTILVYLDANKINSEFFKEEITEGVIVRDIRDTIALSHNPEFIGRNFGEIFKDGVYVDDKTKYVMKSSNADIEGWKITSYMKSSMTMSNLTNLMLGYIIIAVLVMLLVIGISYKMSKSVGKPIDELIKFIRVNRYGEIENISECDDGDIANIKRVFEAMSADLRKNIEKNYEAQMKLTNITVKVLESQMNPHFLFNTLQMIQMLNVLGEKENVSNAINFLGELLRFNLYNKNEVLIRDEMANAVNYLKILELRFKGRFNYKILMPDEVLDCYAVKFALQPLIENSVTHGFSNKKDVCEVIIVGQVIADELVIVIKDNGKGIPPEKLKEIKAALSGEEDIKGQGIGIINVHERIQLTYGEKYGVDIFSDYSKNTQAVVHLPMCRVPQEEK